MLTRRGFIGVSVAGATLAANARLARAQAAADPLAARALEAGEREIVIGGGTGAYVDLVRQYFYDPFTAATGIRVSVIGGSYGERVARLRAMAQVGRMEWDMVAISADSLTPEVVPLLRDLGDCATLPNVAANGISGACAGHAVLFDLGGGVLAYSRDAFPDGRPQPASWADFWNVQAFPGPRSLPNIGTPWWSLIAALLADGVAADRLFPLDLDRAFRKLDQIKPHIAVWWRSGDQIQQLFRSREIVMAMSFSGRMLRLRSEGLPIAMVWNGAPLDAAVWAITRLAPRPNAALALLNFVYTRPEAHAQYMNASFGSTGYRAALDLLSAEDQRLQVSYPDNWSKVVRIDGAWLAANQDAVVRRWTDWLSR
jgi:mannopine transport system substrate-binding protein